MFSFGLKCANIDSVVLHMYTCMPRPSKHLVNSGSHVLTHQALQMFAKNNFSLIGNK